MRRLVIRRPGAVERMACGCGVGRGSAAPLLRCFATECCGLGHRRRVAALQMGATLLRAEPSRAEPSRAEPSRAEPSRAEPSRAEPSRAEPSRAEHAGGPGRAVGSGATGLSGKPGE
ncbi:hypothetical protein GCM10027360_32260 [Amycolatopsis echigonensis]